MRLSDREFFLDKLDLTIPMLKRAADMYENGDTAGACRVFADYIKENIDTSRYFSVAGKGYEGLPKGIGEGEYREMILEGYVYCVGMLYKYEGGRIIWDYNPTYNGYVEYGFHVNHHEEFVHLADAYMESGDERFARRYVDMILSWIEQAECPGKAVSDGARPWWRSIDSGNRMYCAWPYAVCAFLHSESVSPRTWVDIFKSIWEHSYRHVGLNTKYNWHTSEIYGVVTSALLYPFFRESREWLDWAIAEACRQVDMEIYPDGMQAELCTGYQLGVIGSFRAIERRLRAYGLPVPEKFERLYRLLFSSYMKLVTPSGIVNGTNDSSPLPIKRIMKTAVDLFPDDPTYRYFLTDGEQGTPPDYTSVVMPYSGFAVMRTGWERDAIYACLDSGPEGTAHIHEDKLNFTLHAYGANMLDDIGFYAYDTSDMRYFIVGSRSHNTGLVDGYGQNRSATHRWGEGIDVANTQTPAWGEYADVTALSDIEYRDTADVELMAGTYRGDYGPELIKAQHRRKVIFFKRGVGAAGPLFLLLDSFESLDGKPHTYEVSFQERAVPYTLVGGRVTNFFENGATLTTLGDTVPTVAIGQHEPRYVGWRPIHGPEEHEHEPAPFVSFAKNGVSARFVTLLYPSRTEAVPELSVALTDGGFSLSVDGESFAYSYTDPIFAI